jgi:hypothetical protein
VWGAETVPGGFDSHALPPVYKKIYTLDNSTFLKIAYKIPQNPAAKNSIRPTPKPTQNEPDPKTSSCAGFDRRA